MKLYFKMLRSRKKYTGLRSSNVIDVFDRLAYISPEMLNVVNWIRRRPIAVFNPAAVVSGKKLYVFPRMIFGYYHYASVIGVFELDVEELLSGIKPGEFINTRILIYPTETWELALGCEDPRVIIDNNVYIVLYTGVAFSEKNIGDKPHVGISKLYSLQAIAFLDKDLNVLRKDYFKITGYGRYHVPLVWKDSALLGSGIRRPMLTRPMVFGEEICWRCIADLDKATAHVDTFKPIFYNESWERKVGWSTNAVELSSNEYLIGWHGVSKTDGVYRNGLMIVDREGEPQMVSKYYLLAPRGLEEMYGDRPAVIFGDGLVKYKEKIIWVGGVSDHAIGIFAADIEKIMEHMKTIR